VTARASISMFLFILLCARYKLFLRLRVEIMGLCECMLVTGQQSLSASIVQPPPSVSTEANQAAGFVELQASTATAPPSTHPQSQYLFYQQPTTYQHYAGMLHWI